MILYFLRHGHAEPAVGITDHERRLTLEGIKRISNAARVIAAFDMNLSHIFTSPRRRAQETADLVAAALNMKSEICEEVNFGFDVEAIRTLTASLPDEASVMFVGHEPTFSMVIRELTGAFVDMKKGGLARIDLETRQAMRGSLVWLIAPKVFDTLSDSTE